MPRKRTGLNVFEQSIERVVQQFEQGHKLVCAFSGGKDSTCVLEVCLIAAQLTDSLPLSVVLRDEEIMYPGTYEYALRVAQRDDVDFHWLAMQQPVENVFNRQQPFYWAFDPELDPEQWVREPPDFTTWLPEENSITRMVVPERFDVPEGKELISVMGLRGAESRARLCSVYSADGALTKPNKFGVRNLRPIYDWQDGDVWKAISDQQWDYNSCYDIFARMGIPKTKLRVAPPLMKPDNKLAIAAAAWPRWFDRVAKRCPGARQGAQFGVLAATPQRRYHETWRQCFVRTCIDDAPEWIRQRSITAREKLLSRHAAHANTPFPEVKQCKVCTGSVGSWKHLTMAMYSGDPFCSKITHAILPEVEPEYFRKGAGTWDGAPN